MKKALIVSPKYPVAEMTGADIRTMMFARALADHFIVDLAYRQNLDGMERPSVFRRQMQVKAGPPGAVRMTKAWMRHWRRFPFSIRLGYSTAFGMGLAALLEQEDYDLILVRYAFNAIYLAELDDSTRGRVVLDLDDVLSGSLYQTMFAIRTRYRIKRWFDMWQTRNIETYLARAFARTVFCSALDRDRFAATHPVDAARLTVVPNVVSPPVDSVSPPDEARSDKPPLLLFIATLHYIINVQSLRWFVESILPDFVAAYPEGKLWVVGRRPKKEVAELCAHPNVELHADVPSTAPYYSDCDCVVVPLLRGSGTRLKILEAALHERPVISTLIGAEGLDLVPGRDLLLFSDSRSFLAALRDLRQPGRARDIVKSAKEQVAERYSSSAFDEAVKRAVSLPIFERRAPGAGSDVAIS